MRDEDEEREDREGPERLGEAADDAAEPRPEADVLEQAAVVEEERIRLTGPRPEEADEADWQEQSIVEPVDDGEP
jgi:hypothetical protein